MVKIKKSIFSTPISYICLYLYIYIHIYGSIATNDNELKCWGSNTYGELGIGGTTGYGVQYTTPQAVDLGTGRTAVSVSAGQYHTCAVLDDGSLKCWGYDK